MTHCNSGEKPGKKFGGMERIFAERFGGGRLAGSGKPLGGVRENPLCIDGGNAAELVVLKSLEELPEIDADDGDADEADEEERVVDVPGLAGENGDDAYQERHAAGGEAEAEETQRQGARLAPSHGHADQAAQDADEGSEPAAHESGLRLGPPLTRGREGDERGLGDDHLASAGKDDVERKPFGSHAGLGIERQLEMTPRAGATQLFHG